MIYNPLGQSYVDVDIMSDTPAGREINQEYEYLRTTSADEMLPYIGSQRNFEAQITGLESQSAGTAEPSLLSKLFSRAGALIGGKAVTSAPGTPAQKSDMTPALVLGGLGIAAIAIMISMKG